MHLQRKTAKINLSTGEIEIYPTPLRDIENFLGARGMNVLELVRNLPDPNIDPFDPRNPLIFGVGLLTGTSAPNAARFNVTALSPETGILGDSNAGGFFGPAMKYAGFDRLIITGQSKEPCYIYLDDGKAEIRDASHLWGMDTQATQQTIWDDLGTDHEASVIGPAGENRVRMACVLTRKKNSASRGGMGGLMGAKKLKAVVARNTGSLKLHRPQEFLQAVIRLKDYLNGSKVVQTLRKLGTPLLYTPSNTLGAIRTLNSNRTQFDDSLRAEEFHKFSKGAMACAACMVHCRHANKQGGEGPEYSTLVMMGSNIGLSDPQQVIVLNNMCNELGLDTSSTGTIMAWYMDMAQRGMIDEDLPFGDYGLARNLLLKIAYRNGIGDSMADSYQALDRLPEGADKLFIGVKGLPQSDPHDCRYIKSFALGIATSSRGADHLRSRPTLEIFDLPDELSEEIYGKRVNTSPTSYEDKGWIVSTHEDIYAVGDGLGICRFVTHGFNSPHLLKYGHFRELVETATGLRIEDYRQIGRNIRDLERLFNTRCGVSRKDDYPPWKYMEEEATAGIAKGHRIVRENYDQMLDEYYEVRGWNSDGSLRPERIRELEEMVREERP